MATEREEYDFIVVGGGTAGLVVAAHLTEDESKSVLVIEAGANRKGDAKIDTPGMMTSLYDDPDYDWAFMTEPQLDEYMEDKLQGTTGPLQVTIPDGYSSFHEAWMQTFQELGFNTADDPIGGEKLGAFTNPVSIHPTSKTREYSASSYLSDAEIGRPNLHVRTETTVEKINLESGPDGSVTATGVQVLTKDGDRKVFQVKPEGEVIVAAGAIKSPQLLELSGIGNREILSEHGIPLLVDLPGVGQNLQDHVFSSISYEIADNQMSGDCLRNPSILQTVLQQYQVSRSGPMAGTLLSSAYLPTTSDASALSPDALDSLLTTHLDDAPYTAFHSSAPQHALLRSRLADPATPTGTLLLLPLQLNVPADPPPTTQTLLAPTTPGNYITLAAALPLPLSRGAVHIASPDPAAPPRIDPRYLSHPLDRALLARHTQLADAAARCAPLRALLKDGGRTIPSAASPVVGVEAAAEVVRARAWSAWQPVGTCAMMPRGLGGVVDAGLRVHGARGLRVVDASVFPLVPVGGVLATVYAVAEKAADVIKEGWSGGECGGCD
ncbi:GMC oxidoreductase [Neofusicoccum parvum]|nr:GMC oxidoreductase [Neofusicoccum parvum]